MKRAYALQSGIAVLILLLVTILGLVESFELQYDEVNFDQAQYESETEPREALSALDTLEIKGRAPKTGYSRSQFGDDWDSSVGCDTRNKILRRDLQNTIINTKCQVVSGILHDPYTGETIHFQRGSTTSQEVQIDHIVALSDAWQKGAQLLSFEERVMLANDPLELLAVDGRANQQKGDSDAASWLPPNVAFRCKYVARQIAIKKKYKLWVTQAESDAMRRVLGNCPGQRLPVSQEVDGQWYTGIR
jgi:hypothetical protein